MKSLSLLPQRMCACVNSFWHVALWTGTHEPAHIGKRRPLAKVWFACAKWQTRDCPFSFLRHYLVSNVMLPPPPLCWGLNTGAHGCWVCVLPPHNSLSPVLSLQACPCCMVWLRTSFQIRPCCPLLTLIFLTIYVCGERWIFLFRLKRASAGFAKKHFVYEKKVLFGYNNKSCDFYLF